MRYACLLLLACALSAVPVRPQGTPADSYVARAGDVFISEEEFIARFELLPAPRRHAGGESDVAKLELLYSMIAEKLLAQEAQGAGMDREGAMKDAVQEIRKMLARDELYRQEITGHAPVSEAEVVRGIIRAKKQLLVSFIFFDREDEARFVREQMKRPRDFDALRIDSSMNAARDTATVIWGEADPAVEEAAYRLAQGAVSPVVAAGGGYYIIRLKNEQTSPVFGAMQPDALAEKVRTTLRLRKERARLDEFTREFLKDKVGFVIGGNLRKLAEAVLGTARAAGPDTVFMFTPALADSVRKRYKFASTDSLIVINTTVWSVGEVLDRLSVTSLSLHVRSAAAIAAGLHARFRVWVQQELLAAEALRRGLDAVPAIDRRIRMWKEYYLAEQLKGRLKEKVSVNDADVWGYLRAKDPSTPVPQVKIRELRAGSLDGITDALDDLGKGASFESVIRVRSIDPEAKRTGGLTEFFPVTDRYPVGDIASRMHPGERYGPVAVPGGVSYFELVERRDSPAAADTAMAARFAAAREELVKNRQKRLVTAYLAQSAKGRGVDVYGDRVKAITVSPVPMMTFRILGFGGRMFEVPFVETQVDWITAEAPQTRIVP